MNSVPVEEMLRQLAAKRGSPEMTWVIEGFVTRCLKVSKDGAEPGLLNSKQVTCIKNEWQLHCAASALPPPAPVCNKHGQFELNF